MNNPYQQQHQPPTQQFIRTVLAPQFRITPVRTKLTGHAQPVEDDVKFFFDFEQQVLMAAEGASSAEAEVDARTRAKEQLQDIDESTLRRLPQMAELDQGHLRLAMSMLTEDASFDSIKKFCENIEHLKAMGFREDIICGALLKHNGDLSQAITSCLDGS